jgi:hypothetical protein
MKKYIITITTMLFAQIIFAQTTSFTDKNNVFSVNYPTDWKTDDISEDERFGVQLTAPKLKEEDVQGAAVMLVGIEKTPKGIKTLQQFIAMNDKELKKVKEIKLLKKEKVGDKFAYTIQQTEDGKTLKSIIYFWMAKGKIVTATYAAEAKNFNLHIAAAKTVVDSFKMN